MSVLLQRARDSGKCPPSLLSEDGVVAEDSFDRDVLQVLDDGALQLAPEEHVVAETFQALLQKASSSAALPEESSDKKKSVLEQRRTILLAIVAATPRSSPSLARIMSDGYLGSVKEWLDDILSGTVGGIDLLLHLLSSIVDLPVTKATVKSSGMGRAIGTIEKHSICKGTQNESAIKSRVQQVKDAWNASVKALKSAEKSSEPPKAAVIAEKSSEPPKAAVSAEKSSEPPKAAAKRKIEQSSPTSPSPQKRAKVSNDKSKKASSSFSSLLTKISGPGSQEKGAPSATSESASEVSDNSKPNGSSKQPGSKKFSSKRVKWADHFGDSLSNATLVEGQEVSEEAHDTSVSWSDRKKRDRMREKELLAKVKKAKLMDDEDDEMDMPRVEMPKPMVPTMAWRTPEFLPERPDVPLTPVSSSEMQVQNERLKSVPAVRYSSEYEVPASPSPLSDVEQALDMTSQSSAVIATMPFFIPAPVATPAPAVETAAPYDPMQAAQPFLTGATPEFVQSLGLPMFLVGQSTQALQTLAASPGLLNTLVDANGSYDQARLISLVQTLSGSTGTQPQPITAYPSAANSAGIYGGTSTAPYSQVPAFQSQGKTGGYRGSSNSDGNLHVSGYGPSTTEVDIINLFSPYVQVDEVVMKGTFSFVNTSDPMNAQRAKEALNGTLLGGMPIRVNPAQRKARDPNRDPSSAYGPASTSVPSFPGSSYSSTPIPAVSATPFGGPSTSVPIPAAPVQAPDLSQPQNVDDVRDDRGNAATKNLFVAGYGSGTTEQQIRDLFGQYVNVIGVVSKGTFTFVNTSDKAAAVLARQMLGGTQLNGGVLRINFAKETGRLGTSFDLTYGKNTGPNAPRNQPNPMSYYGRGY